MAPTASIKLTYPVWYRGGTREYSNTYHFDGGAPSTDAAWDTLRDNILNAFKLVVPAGVNAMKVDCYAPGNSVAVRTTHPTFAGTYAPSGQGPIPQDCAALLRWSTTQRTSKNHPIYLFSYIHGIEADGGGSGDISKVNSDRTLPAMQTLADDWVSGFSDGTNTYHRAGPNGAVALDGTAEPLIRSHQFPS